MCGIAGVAYVGARSGDDGDALRRMTRTLERRGPDAEGFFFGEGFAFGHRRLTVIDAEGGAQPMRDERRGTTIVFNGEIYNYQELNAELRAAGRTIESRSDTETLLAAYAHWGEACVDRLRGMFAFAIHDAQRQMIFAARDPWGKKPFYFSFANDLFCFASEPKAIIAHPAIGARIDHGALAQYLIHDFVPAPYSIFQGIQKLRAGFQLTLSLKDGKLATRQFCDPARDAPPTDHAVRTQNEWVELLRENIRAAVKRRLISDVPLGVFLSGGIDSSIVAAAAVDIVGRDRVETFSLGFVDPEYDESDRARIVANKLGTRHHESRATEDDVLAAIPAIADYVDEPLADPSILPTYLLARFARQRVTVALGGDGGDELFAGYDTFAAVGPAQWYNRLVPSAIHRGIFRPLVDSLPSSQRRFPLEFKLKRFARGLKTPDHERLFRWIGGLDSRELRQLLAPDIAAQIRPEDDYSLAREYVSQVASLSAARRDLFQFAKLYLGDGVLTKVDRATMACSLEARCPLLDVDLARFIASMPNGVRFPRGKSKAMLRRALSAWIGDAVANLPKRGFGIPVGPWLRGKMKPILMELLSHDRIKKAGLFRPEYVDRIVSEHLAGRQDHRKILWSLLVFEMWRERWWRSAN